MAHLEFLQRRTSAREARISRNLGSLIKIPLETSRVSGQYGIEGLKGVTDRAPIMPRELQESFREQNIPVVQPHGGRLGRHTFVAINSP